MVKDRLSRTVVTALLLSSCLVRAAMATPGESEGLESPFVKAESSESGTVYGKNDQLDLGQQLPKREAEKYLEQFGYLDNLEHGDTGHHQNSITKAIREFQQFAGFHDTGELDHVTVNKMRQPRCGHADVTKPSQRSREGIGRRSSDTLAPGFSVHSAWDKHDLTYRFENYYSKLPQAKQEEAIANAFQVWADVSPLNFHQVRRNIPTDLVIRFGSGNHGDSSPFDGQGMVLAHASYPPTGGIHFDSDEEWSLSGKGSNLEIVAAHEIGHSLGLGHSSNKAALMTPFYAYDPDYALDQDDIDGIHFLYTIGCQSANTTCYNGGTCKTDKRPSYCVCTPRYEGLRCKRDKGCQLPRATCLNEGNCTLGSHIFYCKCPPGYMGDRCEKIIECKSQHTYCLNNGTCKDNGRASYCQCPKDHEGGRCQTAKECNSEYTSCLNGGTCKLGKYGHYDCQCPLAYVGDRCQTARNCLSARASCLNHGVCVTNGKHNPTCQCQPGYQGSRCERGKQL
ncbi:hypothetical protein ACOMHN_013349 [Nucella lapillus]